MLPFTLIEGLSQVDINTSYIQKVNLSNTQRSEETFNPLFITRFIQNLSKNYYGFFLDFLITKFYIESL